MELGHLKPLLILQYIILNLNFRSFTTAGTVLSSDYCPTREPQVSQAKISYHETLSFSIPL